MANTTLSPDEILEAIGNMSVFELAGLIETFKTKFNVTIAAAPVAGAPGGFEAAGRLDRRRRGHGIRRAKRCTKERRLSRHCDACAADRCPTARNISILRGRLHCGVWGPLAQEPPSDGGVGSMGKTKIGA